MRSKSDFNKTTIPAILAAEEQTDTQHGVSNKRGRDDEFDCRNGKRGCIVQRSSSSSSSTIGLTRCDATPTAAMPSMDRIRTIEEAAPNYEEGSAAVIPRAASIMSVPYAEVLLRAITASANNVEFDSMRPLIRLHPHAVGMSQMQPSLMHYAHPYIHINAPAFLPTMGMPFRNQLIAVNGSRRTLAPASAGHHINAMGLAGPLLATTSHQLNAAALPSSIRNCNSSVAATHSSRRCLEEENNNNHDTRLALATQQYMQQQKTQRKSQSSSRSSAPKPKTSRYQLDSSHAQSNVLQRDRVPVVRFTSGGHRKRADDSTSTAVSMNNTNLILHIPDDHEKLNENQIFLRQQIEFFRATQEDILSLTRGKNKPIVLQQVGIRCCHCSHVPVGMRKKASAYFPSNLMGIYQACQNLSVEHLQSQLCPQIPCDVQRRFSIMSRKKAASGAGRKYWAEAASKLGLIDTEDGIRFAADVVICQTAEKEEVH